MKKPIKVPADAPDLIEAIVHRITEHGDEVRDTLRRVSVGEIDMVETITDSDKDLTRRFFAWIAHSEPGHARAILAPPVAEALAEDRPPHPHALNDDMIIAARQLVHVSTEVIHKVFGEHLAADSGSADHEPRILEVASILREAKKDYPHGLTGLAVITLSYVFYEDFHHPRPETAVYDIAHKTSEKLRWVYRYWFNQLEVAEPGSGLEEFFQNQVLENPVAIDLTDAQSVSRVSLSCAGDLLAVDVLTPENTEHLFDDIIDFYSSADIVSANLESTVYSSAAPGRNGDEPGQPFKMNTSQAMFDRFRDQAGINFFSTATNHSNDWGTAGLLATLDVLAVSGADHSGTARTRAEQDDVVVVDKNGIKIALLTFTFDLNGRPVPTDQKHLVNEVRFNDADPAPDYDLVERQIAAAKAKGAEFIVAYCHWGWEFEMYPHVDITRAAHEVVARGVDVILGNHPHVPQPAQVIDRGPERPRALVTYAFGDFVSYHPESRNSKLTYAVKFDIAKVTTPAGTYISWDHLEALPLYIVNAPLGGDRFDCRIVKFENVLADPDGFGLTDREKSELPHLRDVVWKGILSPLSHIPVGGWSGPR